MIEKLIDLCILKNIPYILNDNVVWFSFSGYKYAVSVVFYMGHMCYCIAVYDNLNNVNEKMHMLTPYEALHYIGAIE